jgi:hypothetical protein
MRDASVSQEIIAIEQLIHAYCHRVDHGTPDEVAALFAADAALRPFYDGHYEVRGRAAVRSWYAYYETHFKAAVRHLKHMVMSPLIEVQGEQASGVCYLIASAVTISTGQAFSATGTYTDEYVCSAGQWLFKSRQIELEMMPTPSMAVEHFRPLGFPDGVKI